MIGLLVGVAGVLLAGSAFISAAVTATFSVSPSRLRTLREEGFRGADPLQEARDRAGTILDSALFVDTVLNCLAVGALTAAAVIEWGPAGLVAAPAATILGVLLIGGALPRFIGGRRSIRLGLLSAPFLLGLARLTGPFVVPFFHPDEILQRRNGNDAESPDEREVRELSELGKKEGVVGEEEHRLVERAFRMDELSAWDVMTPRVDIFAWRNDVTLAEIVPELQNVPYSRVPIYGDSIDDITGILYVREAYEAWVAGKGSRRLAELAREPFFLPGSLPLPALLRDFQARRLHMGIVADEFGGTDGLVTLEDVLEELVGEIEDERDLAIAEEMLVRISRDEIDVDGAIELREVNYVFNLSLPQLEHRSLNGFLLEEMGRVPTAGEELELPGLHVGILEASETQVLRARLRKVTTGVPITGGDDDV